MATETRRELDKLLKQLEQEERTISKGRRRLQDQIDYFAAENGAETTAPEELRRRERELSDRRRELHRQIEELRARRGRVSG